MKIRRRNFVATSAGLAAGTYLPITSELELFLAACPSKQVIGVTGSNGKSTTSAMIAAVLTAAVFVSAA